MPICLNINERVTVRGVCEPCPEYMKPMFGRKQCGADKCVGRQYLLKNGSCETCPDYQISNEKDQRRSCIRRICPSGEQVGRDSNCYKCAGKLNDDYECVEIVEKKTKMS